MPNLGSLWYTMGIKDLTDADLKKINDKLKNAGAKILLTPELVKSVSEILPKGLKLELDPQLKAVTNEMLAKAAEGKVMKVEVMPLISSLRKALKEATKNNPPEMEVGVQSAKLRKLIEDVLNKHGFLINISTVNDNYTKVVQQKLNGTHYTVKIHADAKEITRSVQASLMQVQSRYFGLQVSRDILYRSIDEALGSRRFNINIAVQHDQARKAVQDALLRAQVIGNGQNLAYQRSQAEELRAVQAELAKLKAAHMDAADAAKAHSSATKEVGDSLFSLSGPINELKSMLANLWSIQAAKEFLSQVIEIGGELEHQKIAMDTIFGDKGKTLELFGQIKGLARQSPFGVMELTKSIKALSAYGVEYNEIYDTAKRLADISAATSVDINRLILAFGKTKSRGFLDGLEAKQFAYANIPIYEMVRRKLEELEGQAVTTAEVMARMKKREIGFDIVKDVLWDMTDEGGKFYNMQEALAGSVKTSWKLVRDNIELMFGEIAESNIGGALKDIAETLQLLTRNWRSMGTAIGLAALSFGVYKVAVAASNTMMGQANALALQKATASNKVAAANAMEAASYRVLTQAEDYAILAKSGLAKLNRSLLLSHIALAEAEWDAVLASEAVSKDYILRRIALNRLTQAEIDYLISIKAVGAEEVRTAMRAQGLKVSLASLWTMTKAGAASAWASMLNFFTRFKVGASGLMTSVKAFKLASLFTWIKTLPSRLYNAEIGVTRLKLAFSGLGRAMSSIGAFLLNPVTILMAAMGGLAYAWEKNNEQMEKAKEIGDNIFTKATEGANNLKQTLNEIKPSSGLSNHELTQGIEQMEQAIKDYSPRPLQDINDTLVAQDGHVLTLAERYDALKKKVEGVAEAYRTMGDLEKGDVGTMVSDAIKSTGGILNDVVTVNAKDYTESLKRRSDAIRDATKNNTRWIKKAVDEAIAADDAFAKVAKGMKNTATMFAELASNPEKYSAEYQLPAVQAVVGSSGITSINQSIKEDKAKFESDVQDFIKDLTANIRITWDREIQDLDDSQKDALAIALKNMLDQADGVSEDVKMRWAQKLEDVFGITIIEDKIGPALKGKLLSLVNSAVGADIIAIVDKWKNEGWDALSEDEKEAISEMMEYAKTEVTRELSLTNEKMQSYLNNNPLIQTIQLAYSEAKASDYQQEVWKSSPKLAGLLSEAISVPNIDAGSLTDKAKKQRTWYNEWTRGSKGDYETKNKIKSDLEALHNEIIASKNRSAEYRKMKQDEFDAKMELAEAMGLADIELKALKSNKHGKPSSKDPLAESLKQRFKDIKDAWSEFQKWSKTEGREAAATRIGDSGLFSTLPKDKIPKTIEDYRALVKGLEDELRKAGVKGTAREGLLNDLLKQLLDIDKTVVDEQLKLALDKVSKEAERQLADWNLFDKIRKATGNQQLAMSIAFGMGVSGETDYVTMVKNQFDEVAKAAKSTLTFDTATPDALTEAPDEVKKAWEKAYDLIQKYRNKEREDVANMVEQYRSTQEEIIALTAEAEEKKRKIRESKNLTPVEKQQITDKIDADLNYEVFRKSGEYLKFFNAILSMAGNEAEKVGQKIKDALDDKLKAGQITAKEYCDEMEKIDKQLEKIRQKQKGFGGLGSFAKGGLQQMFNDRFEQAQSDYNAATQNFDTAKQQFDLFSKEGNEAGMQQAQSAMDAASAMKDGAASAMQGAQGAMSTVAMIDTIVHGINDTVQGIKGSFDLIADMADSFGVDTSADTGWGSAGAFLDAFSEASQHATNAWDSLKSGNVGGVIQGVVGSITSWFTTFNRWHDAKLQKQIERSQEAAQIMQNQYDILEKRMANFLGNAAAMNTGVEGGAYGKQLELMKGQLGELEKQRQLEMDKKKSDDSVVEDYNQQIEEMKISIQDFAIEAANAVYGIDLNGWAGQLGDALVDAFAAGEDAAEAFDNTVSDIMRSLVSKMISQDLIAPMFDDVRDYLFGENGVYSKAADGGDFVLSEEDAIGLAERLQEMQGVVENAKAIYDQINEATGGMLDDTEAKSGLSAGIQGVTEDTADLLASYLNAIRADVSLQTYDYWTRLLNESLPQISVIAQSQLDCQRQIAENTLRNALAAEAIVKSNDDISRLLTRVTQGGAKFYVN